MNIDFDHRNEVAERMGLDEARVPYAALIDARGFQKELYPAKGSSGDMPGEHAGCPHVMKPADFADRLRAAYDEWLASEPTRGVAPRER